MEVGRVQGAACAMAIDSKDLRTKNNKIYERGVEEKCT